MNGHGKGFDHGGMIIRHRRSYLVKAVFGNRPELLEGTILIDS
jgi:hypothetical protein